MSDVLRAIKGIGLVNKKGVVKEKGFIKLAKPVVTGDETSLYTACKWGLYNSEGEEIFAQNYFDIKVYVLNVSGVEQTVFCLTEYDTGKSALVDSQKRIIIPWKLHSIEVDAKKNIVTTFVNVHEVTYSLSCNEENQLNAVEEKNKC